MRRVGSFTQPESVAPMYRPARAGPSAAAAPAELDVLQLME